MEKSDQTGLSVKDRTIGRLYALRAGLSVVAREKEKADGIMRRAERDRAFELQQIEQRIESKKKKIEGLEGELSALDNKRSATADQLASPGLAGRIFKIFGLFLKISIMYLLPIAAVVFGALQCAFYSQRAALSGFLKAVVVLDAEWGIEIIVGGIVLAIILTVIYVKKKIFFLMLPRWCSLKLRKTAPQRLEQLKQKKDEMISTIDRENKELALLQNRRKQDEQAAEEEYASKQRQATEHAMAGLAVIDALEDTFGDMIDVRDWENTDILIYALETRRAENMKEALQVVDGERRTERIVEAVTTAGREICKSIGTGLRRLQGEMTRCFGLLGKIIVDQGELLSSKLDVLGGQIAVGNNYIAQLTSQQEMTNALIAKSNETSAAIAQEASMLRTSAEYAQAQLTYGTR